MNIKTHLLAILAILAPVGCDEAPEQNELAREVVPGLSLADIMDLDLLVDEAPSAAPAHGEFELMSNPDHSFAETLCCGHNKVTWDCGGKDQFGRSLLQLCDTSVYCTVGACDGDAPEEIEESPVPIDPIDPIEIQLPGDQV